ncbi:MAG TPA: hypothetical protein VHY22_19175 [Chthoniobacteraceae bacterium]|jgi:hypothetical protein|nr:hypothetical protein [Chthoniobacteraceae bacterium]
MKKAFLWAVILLAALGLAAAQDTVPPSTTEFARFIESLPTANEMRHDGEIAGRETQPAINDQQRNEARTRLAKARIDYDHLYSLLHEGASVFDYPGLLAISRHLFVNGDGTYSIRMGIPPRLHTPDDPGHSYFLVRFNQTGVIIRVITLLNPLANI